MLKYIRPAVIFLLLAAICLSQLPIAASATPQSHPNTHVNTGDQRSDVIAIAKTQVGYLEGANNDTKYGDWYGYNNIAWCGIYVAWCANQAGVPTSVLARTGIANPAAYGLSAKPEGYVPLPGDLFFTRSFTHVGFVYYVDGEYFYSLEGNTWENGPEGVYIRRHRLSEMIYASPNYQGGGSHRYILGNETEHPHKEFYQCTDCADRYYTGNSGVRSDCRTCIQNNCSHSYSGFAKLSNTQHSRTCSLCSKQEIAAHVWNAGTTLQAATCSAVGRKLQKCLECGTEATITITATGQHSFSKWEKTDEDSHGRRCTACQKTESLPHDLRQRQTDETHHWFSCGICGQEVQKEEHAFGPNCDSPCTVCEYMRPDGHRYSTKMLFDSNAHWFACEVCGLVEAKADHAFIAECDDTCDSCAFTRSTEHSFESEHTTDETSHWYTCSTCGQKKDLQAHIPEEVQRQGAIQRCTVCRLVLTSESMHSHGYDTVCSDQERHWGACSCGMEMEPESHRWSVRTETCSVCGQFMPARQVDYLGLIPWVAGIFAILLVGTVLLILLLRKRK